MRFTERIEGHLQKHGVPLLCAFGFFADFKPSEAFITPYLVQNGFTKAQVNNNIYPFWGYSYLVSLLLTALVIGSLKHQILIRLGAIARLGTRILLLWGTSVMAMQFMQISFGFASATEIVFFSYIYLLVPGGVYQKMTSYLAACQLSAHVLSAFAGQLSLDYVKVSLRSLFTVSLVSVSVSVIFAFILPSPPPQEEERDGEYLIIEEEEPIPPPSTLSLLVKSYKNKEVLMWSTAMAGAVGINGLVLNYQYSLFYDINSHALFNGYVMGIARICGFIGGVLPLFFVPSENMKNRASIIMIFSILSCSIAVVIMSLAKSVIIAYITYTIYELFFVLSYTIMKAQLARLSNGRVVVILLVNTLIGVSIQDLLQIGLYGLSMHIQFLVWGGFLGILGVIFFIVKVKKIN